VVNILVFILGCFIDFFEIAFIVIPILMPVAEKILPGMFPPGTPVDAIMVWFGVVLAMNLQTSFLTPPFGFALFYLRSVAAKADYKDRITGENIPAVTTAQIYKGSIAFICLQVIMVAAVIAFPGMVTDGIGNAVQIDADKALESMGMPAREAPAPMPGMDAGASAPGAAAPSATENNEDPMKALLESVNKDATKK